MAAIKDFNCSWLSWKNKYEFLIKKYKIDKRANEVSRTDRIQEYKWYHKMDKWHDCMTIVHNHIVVSATNSWEQDFIPSIYT